MSKVLVSEENLTNIANSIREKTGTEDTYKPSEMASAISGISTGGGSAPEKGFVINEWDENGKVLDMSIVGFTTTPGYYCYNMFTQYSASWPGTFGESTKVHLPETLEELGNSTFRNCSTLVLLELPSGLKRISSNVFDNCSRLALTELPSGVVVIGTEAFSGCSSLALTELPSGLKRISRSAFAGCTSLALTELPSGVRSIDESAFSSCPSLALTELPSGVTTLPKSGFSSCSKLEHIILKGDITSIFGGNYYGTFVNCSSLKTIIMPNNTDVPTMTSGSYAFNGTPIASGTGYIYVPDTLVDSFKSATNWSTYADQIKPISELPTE